MAKGRRRDRARTPGLWIATNELPRTGGQPFYQRLNGMLDEHAFEEFVEARCAPFYAKKLGRPGLTPGMYFRLLLIAMRSSPLLDRAHYGTWHMKFTARSMLPVPRYFATCG